MFIDQVSQFDTGPTTSKLWHLQNKFGDEMEPVKGKLNSATVTIFNVYAYMCAHACIHTHMYVYSLTPCLAYVAKAKPNLSECAIFVCNCVQNLMSTIQA